MVRDPSHADVENRQHTAHQGSVKSFSKPGSRPSAKSAATTDSTSDSLHVHVQAPAAPAASRAARKAEAADPETLRGAERRPLVARARSAAVSELAGALKEWRYRPVDGRLQMLTQRCLELWEEASLQVILHTRP
jgi:hypothetical protein